jgi:lipopolysaccharide biosynthesis protein
MQGRLPCRQSGRQPHLHLMYNQSLTTTLDAVPSLRPLDENDYCMAVPCQIDLGTPPLRRIAATIHLYYTKLFPEIMEYLRNAPFGTDLFISTDIFAKKSIILETLKTYSNGTVKVIVFENRGRDIAPFIVGYAHVLKLLNWGYGFELAAALLSRAG